MEVSTPAANVGEALYIQLADWLKQKITDGVYPIGTRIPSVRQLKTQMKVSASTAVAAYRYLEQTGIIEARPQSGYYVRSRVFESHSEPDICSLDCEPTTIGVNQLAMRLLKSSRDTNIYQLGIGTPHPSYLPIRELNRIQAAITKRYPERSFAYEFPPGAKELRMQIARRAHLLGCDLAPDQIVITSGCIEALSLCLRAVASPGDTIAIESPAFFGTLQLIETLGMRAIEIPTHPRDGISLEALSLALDQWPIKACLFVTNFSNPLGACISAENKRKLIRLLAERNIPLIEDDIYGDLSFSAERPITAKAYDKKGSVLLCSSFSKTLAPGYRVGWVAPGKYLQQIEHLKYVNTMATSALPQMVIAEYLDHGGYERHLRRIKRIYADNIARVTDAVLRYFPEDTRTTKPLGGFMLWVEMPRDIDALKLYKRALEKNIAIAPGQLSSARQQFHNCIRLNCAIPWDERLDKALYTLGRLGHELAAKR